MRILLHDNSGHPFQVQLARALARRGHVVRHLFNARFQTPRGSLTHLPGDPTTFEVAPIDPGRPMAKYDYFTRFRQERAYGRLLERELEAFQPDVALLSNTPPDSLLAPQRWCRSHHRGFVFWVQDVYAEAIARLVAPKLGPLGAPVVWHYRRLEAGLLRRSDEVVAITDDFRPLLKSWRIEEKRISTIENWAPLEELPPRARDNDFAREHGLNGRLVFMYSGTLGLKHNPGLLLGIAERYRADPGVRVIVVSEGLGATWLAERKQAEGLDNLILLPFQPFSRMPDMLASADVLMAILEPEAGVYSVPSKVLTYLCAGRPLLAAMPAQNLAARTITGQQAGIVVAPDDARGFADAAARLNDEPATRTTLGCNARRYAETTFDIHKVTDRFETILGRASRSQ